jgi:hypothetical protein
MKTTPSPLSARPDFLPSVPEFPSKENQVRARPISGAYGGHFFSRVAAPLSTYGVVERVGQRPSVSVHQLGADVATLWLRHGCPWSIGCGDPRSQKRDLGHPSRFSDTAHTSTRALTSAGNGRGHLRGSRCLPKSPCWRDSEWAERANGTGRGSHYPAGDPERGPASDRV